MQDKSEEKVKPEIYNPETGEIVKIEEVKQLVKAKENESQSIWANLFSDTWQPVGKSLNMVFNLYSLEHLK